MKDDTYTATELRRRYHMGGDLKDDNLTAPQLRARYGIKRNRAGAKCANLRCSAARLRYNAMGVGIGVQGMFSIEFNGCRIRPHSNATADTFALDLMSGSLAVGSWMCSTSLQSMEMYEIPKTWLKDAQE